MRWASVGRRSSDLLFRFGRQSLEFFNCEHHDDGSTVLLNGNRLSSCHVDQSPKSVFCVTRRHALHGEAPFRFGAILANIYGDEQSLNVLSWARIVNGGYLPLTDRQAPEEGLCVALYRPLTLSENRVFF